MTSRRRHKTRPGRQQRGTEPRPDRVSRRYMVAGQAVRHLAGRQVGSVRMRESRRMTRITVDLDDEISTSLGRTRQRDRKTSSIAVPCLVRGPGWCGPGPGRTPGSPGRVRSFRRDHDGPAAGPRRQGASIKPGGHRPGPRGRQQARSGGKAGIQTCPAQRGNQGLQPRPGRPGAHDQRGAARHSSSPGQTRQRYGANVIPQRHPASGSHGR